MADEGDESTAAQHSWLPRMAFPPERAPGSDVFVQILGGDQRSSATQSFAHELAEMRARNQLATYWSCLHALLPFDLHAPHGDVLGIEFSETAAWIRYDSLACEFVACALVLASRTGSEQLILLEATARRLSEMPWSVAKVAKHLTVLGVEPPECDVLRAFDELLRLDQLRNDTPSACVTLAAAYGGISTRYPALAPHPTLRIRIDELRAKAAVLLAREAASDIERAALLYVAAGPAHRAEWVRFAEQIFTVSNHERNLLFEMEGLETRARASMDASLAKLSGCPILLSPAKVYESARLPSNAQRWLDTDGKTVASESQNSIREKKLTLIDAAFIIGRGGDSGRMREEAAAILNSVGLSKEEIEREVAAFATLEELPASKLRVWMDGFVTRVRSLFRRRAEEAPVFIKLEEEKKIVIQDDEDEEEEDEEEDDDQAQLRAFDIKSWVKKEPGTIPPEHLVLHFQIPKTFKGWIELSQKHGLKPVNWLRQYPATTWRTYFALTADHLRELGLGNALALDKSFGGEANARGWNAVEVAHNFELTRKR
jgi:hypothetical protein